MDLQYRQQIAFLGMLVGAITGGIAALLWLDYVSDHDASEVQTSKVGFGDMARIAAATVALARQIHSLAEIDEGESENS